MDLKLVFVKLVIWMYLIVYPMALIGYSLYRLSYPILPMMLVTLMYQVFIIVNHSIVRFAFTEKYMVFIEGILATVLFAIYFLLSSCSN